MVIDNVPAETIKVFARSIHSEAVRYGFSLVDMLRLINELMDVSTGPNSTPANVNATNSRSPDILGYEVNDFPLQSDRIEIRLADTPEDLAVLKKWMRDEYGRHFLLFSMSAQKDDLELLMKKERNQVGMVLAKGAPIGAVAFLDIDNNQRRAELRKLIGDKNARGKGLAEEATRLWIQYGFIKLGLEKIFVSTLQTNIRNIQLNESIGFRVEGLLQNEVLIGDRRYDVLRMGLTNSRDGLT